MDQNQTESLWIDLDTKTKLERIQYLQTAGKQNNIRKTPEWYDGERGAGVCSLISLAWNLTQESH